MPVSSAAINTRRFAVWQTARFVTRDKDEQYSDEEGQRRAEDAIRRSFSMPYKPQKALVGQSRHRSKPPKKAKQKA